MKSLLLFLCAFAAATCAAAAERPNIVFILADDLGYGDLGCYNAESKIPTPRLDRFARQGLRFTDGHAGDTTCTPSRYSLLTGRYCFRSRLKTGVLVQWDPPLIDSGLVTLPAFLRSAGYATAAIGKWHLGWTWPVLDGKPPGSKDGIGNIDFTRSITDGPITRGFDSFFGVDLPNYPPYVFIRNDRTVGTPTLAAPLKPGGINRPGPMLPGWSLPAILPTITHEAVHYIERTAGADAHRPYFLYLALTAPHYPIAPTPEFKGRSRAGDYGDYVNEVDAMVGDVLDAIERAGQADNTLVFFCSDNGPEVLELDRNTYERIRVYGHSSIDGLRGVKRDAWEGGHRVPFLVRWPGHVPAGAVSAEPVSEIDVMATCAALLQTPLPAGAAEDSCNILPALLGQKIDQPLRPYTVLHSNNGKFGLRQGDWVFIDAPSGTGNGAKGAEPEWFKKSRGYVDDGAPGELYNLADDLPERRNLFREKPEIVARMKSILAPYEAVGRKTAQSRPSIPSE